MLSKALAKDPSDRFDRCREFATKLSERAHFDPESDRFTEAGITVEAPRAGTQTQVAVSRPHGESAEQGSPSDAQPPPTGPTKKRRSRRLILVGVAAAVVVVAVLGVIGYIVKPKKHTTTTPATSTQAPVAPPLDGTYRLDGDFSKETSNGAPAPQPNTDNIGWWAYRSSCTSTGCVATGTGLDKNNHQVARTPALTAGFHFVDGHWQSSLSPRQVPRPWCLGANGTVVAGADTETFSWSLEPQPDGTLRGVQTLTVLTNECGNQGKVTSAPFVATRTGDVPPSVTVADPATVTGAPTTSTRVPPVAGPVLDGTFRVDFDYTKQTANGVPAINTVPNDSVRWAFHSMCTSAGCVGAGVALPDEDQQAGTVGAAVVLRFADGHWQDTPYLRPSAFQCPGATNRTVTYTATSSWSLEPRPDGTLRGVQTVTVLTNECGNQGMVYRTPFMATRIGDVPPTVTLADPALFTGPTAPTH